MNSEEDNDDVVEILDTLCPKLKELYGEYYISEIIGRHPESGRKIIVAQVNLSKFIILFYKLMKIFNKQFSSEKKTT